MHTVKVSPELVELLEELVADAGLDPESALRWSYSGRAMYGDTCLGIVGSVNTLFRFALALGEVYDPDDDVRLELNEIIEAMKRGMRYDSMGYDTIYYWPSVGRQ